MKKRYMFNKVAIVGVGLIGGSLALDINSRGLARTVVGICRRSSTLRRVRASGAVHRLTLSLKEGVGDADLVIIAAPVDTIISSAKRLSRSVKRGSIIMDVGSTKREVLRAFRGGIPREVFFIGCHPMAGSEKAGVENARKNLFKGTLCFVVSDAASDKGALNKVRYLWRRLGSRVVTVSAGRHDDIVAAISHLPHLAAVALMNSVPRRDLEFSAGGFQDATRIASSSESIWKGIFSTNSDRVCIHLDRYIRHLNMLKGILRRNDLGSLKRELEKARRLRETV